LGWFPSAGYGDGENVIAEKNLNWDNDRERHSDHHCKHQRHQSYTVGPTEHRALATRAAPAEKPGT